MILYMLHETMAAAGVPANRVDRARKIRRKDTTFRQTTGNIAAIDFGTKNCSLAYVTVNDPRALDLLGGTLPKLPLNDTYSRVPTVVLLNAGGRTEQLGHFARSAYLNLDDREKKMVAYFDKLKMNLARDANVNREMSIPALNGERFFLVDIIAQILSFLKDKLLAMLCMGGHMYRATDFDWVVTVPAIWTAQGKHMMRVAAYKAGLCSETQIHRATPIDRPQPQPEEAEPAPDRLTLALEPECGAIYCHVMALRGQVAPHSTRPTHGTLPNSYSYLIVDMGGGTVDISAHKVQLARRTAAADTQPLEVEELHHPDGDSLGGEKVNLKFSNFLQRLVNDRAFSRYCDRGDWETRTSNRFELDELLGRSFDEKKHMFCCAVGERRGNVSIRLPDSFTAIYGESLEEGVERLGGEHVKLVRGQVLRLSTAKMEEFLSPIIEEITDLVKQLIGKIEEKIDVIYLVGGFGGCPYVGEKFMERFGEKCQIITPRSPECAIVEGAILFRAHPSIVRARKACHTYGKSVMCKFDASKHDPEHQVEVGGTAYCQNLFQTIVEAGETVSADCVYTCTSAPLRTLEPTSMHVQIFSCKEREVFYTEEPFHGAPVTKIGELIIDVPAAPQRRGRGGERELEITFDFSHTEIQVRAIEKTSRTEVKTVIDFLPRD